VAIARILKRRGFVVSEARTVSGALTQLVHEPDWILLDLMLPDGSGIDVLRKVKKDGLASKVCIITGCAPEMMHQARIAGAECGFMKPLDIDRLMTLLTA
jgi:DNA-binding response OmpR family regulator